jgi:hypothetical protein
LLRLHGERGSKPQLENTSNVKLVKTAKMGDMIGTSFVDENDIKKVSYEFHVN